MTASNHVRVRRRVLLSLLSTGFAGIALGLETAPVLRAAIVTPYLLFVPGYMVVQLVHANLGLFVFPAAVGVSASALATIGVVLVAAGAWAPPLAMALMMMITLVAAGLGLAAECRPAAAGRRATAGAVDGR